MPAKILFRDATGRDGAVELRHEPVYVGRAVECAIRTDDAMVSRKHSMVRFDQGRFWVEDLGSSNGTHVNDQKITGRYPLSHNDVVRCGSLWLRYVEDGPLMPAAPPPRAVGHMSTQGADLGYASTVATPARAVSHPGMSSRPPFGGLDSPASVVVDMKGSSEDVEKLRRQLDDVRYQLDQIRTERDKEVAENKRLRAEYSTFQQRLDDAKGQLAENEEVMEAHKRVAEELRIELGDLKAAHNKVTSQLVEAREDLSARNRQLQRAQEDVLKVKQEVEQHKKQLLEVSKVKEEGWKKLNEQLAEVEHLREVIREQERILEERRVGLMSLEQGLKDLRNDREQRLKELAQIKAERDELRLVENRRAAQLQATEEENRRLARLLADLESGVGSDQKHEVMRLSSDLRDLQVALKKMEGERDALAEELARAERRANRAETEVARLEEMGSEEGKKAQAAEQARQKADEVRQKAELALRKGEEEKASIRGELDQAREELVGLRRRAAELEAAAPGGAGNADAERQAAELQGERDELRRRLEILQGEVTELRRGLQAAHDEASAARAEASDARTRLAAASDRPAPAPAAGDGDLAALKERASEVYMNINDVLNNLRVNVELAKDELKSVAGKAADDRLRTIIEAVETADGQIDEVKGVLRGLRELAEA